MDFKEYISPAIHLSKMKQEIRQSSFILRKTLDIPSQKSEEKIHDVADAYWNTPELKSFLTKNNIPLPKGVPAFADGGVGRVYFLGKHVVKLSQNKVEANVAKMVANSPNLPTVVIDVQPIGNRVYAILQEYVNTHTIDMRIRVSADVAMTILDRNPQISQTGWPKDSVLAKLSKDVLQHFNQSLDLIPWILAVIKTHNMLYHATGFFHDDAVGSNVGLHPKKGVVFPDLGPNQSGSYSDADALAKIKSNRKQLQLPDFDEI